jgi:hypothetical protein
MIVPVQNLSPLPSTNKEKQLSQRHGQAHSYNSVSQQVSEPAKQHDTAQHQPTYFCEILDDDKLAVAWDLLLSLSSFH